MAAWGANGNDPQVCGLRATWPQKLEWIYLLRQEIIFQSFLILSEGTKVPAHRMVSTKLVGQCVLKALRPHPSAWATSRGPGNGLPPLCSLDPGGTPGEYHLEREYHLENTI